MGDAVSAAIIGMVAGMDTMTPFGGSRKIVEEAAEITKKMSGGEVSEKVVTIVFAEVQYIFSGLIKKIDIQNDARFEKPEGN